MFIYNPITGLLINKIYRNGRSKINKNVGWLNDSGYLITQITGKKIAFPI